MNKQKGFTAPEGVLVAVALIVLGLIGWLVVQNLNRPPADQTSVEQQSAQGPENTESQKAQIDTQIKSDLARAAAAVTEYVANNSGNYPANDTQAAAVLQNYISLSNPFISPITDASYRLVLSNERAQGVINLERGTCNAQLNGVVPTQNTRTYAVLTQLSDKSVYCVDI